MSDSAAQNRTPKLDHLLSKVGGVWWIARQQAEEELGEIGETPSGVSSSVAGIKWTQYLTDQSVFYIVV